jgi:hypothetical protein
LIGPKLEIGSIYEEVDMNLSRLSFLSHYNLGCTLCLRKQN